MQIGVPRRSTTAGLSRLALHLADAAVLRLGRDLRMGAVAKEARVVSTLPPRSLGRDVHIGLVRHTAVKF